MQPSGPPTQILFVTGKGGVGKSSVALAYALKFARQGLRTLLVEMGYHSYLSDFLQLPAVGYTPLMGTAAADAPAGLPAGLDAVCWSGEQCLREYALHYLKIERIYRIFFENRVMKALLDVAPGLREISLLGKITSGARHAGPAIHYERVVVDGFATGHALAFFKTPRALAESIGVGPMGEQSRGIDRALRDPEVCSYKIVTLFEELPVTETEELSLELRRLLGCAPEVIANKVLMPPVSEPELAAYLGHPRLGDFARYLRDALERQRRYRQRLQATTGLAAELPLQFDKDPWRFAHHLRESLP